MCGGSAACSVVRYTFRLVTAANSALLHFPRDAVGSLCFPSPFPSSSLLHQSDFAFRIVCDGEVVRFERNPCGEVNSLIDNGRSHKSHTSESICQPHQSLKYKPVRVQRSSKSVENLIVIRTCDGRRGRNRRRAVPGAEITVVDDRRACACAIRPTIAGV